MTGRFLGLGVCGSEKGWQCGYGGNRAGVGLCHCAWREFILIRLTFIVAMKRCWGVGGKESLAGEDSDCHKDAALSYSLYR